MHHGSQSGLFLLRRVHEDENCFLSFGGTKCHFVLLTESLQSGNVVSQHHHRLTSVSTSEVMVMLQTDASAAQVCISKPSACSALQGILETTISARNEN